MIAEASEPRTASVYVLLDEGTRKIRYVGQSVRLRHRLAQHWQRRKLAAHLNPALAEWLRSLSAPPECQILQAVPYEQRFKAEEYWTDLLREVPGIELLNISSGARMSPDSLARLGAATAALWQTDEYRTKVIEARKAMWQQPEHRAKMHAAMKGRVISPEARANMSAALKGRKDIGEASRRM